MNPCGDIWPKPRGFNKIVVGRWGGGGERAIIVLAYEPLWGYLAMVRGLDKNVAGRWGGGEGAIIVLGDEHLRGCLGITRGFHKTVVGRGGGGGEVAITIRLAILHSRSMGFDNEMAGRGWVGGVRILVVCAPHRS